MKSKKDSVSGTLHFMGAIASIIALIFLVAYSALYGKGIITIISFAIFGVSMILLYTASTVYHLVKTKSNILRKIDHIMIFVLIAGTYTPILLGPLNSTLGIVLLICLWSLVVIGIFIKIFWLNAPRWLSTGIYLGMGWSALFIMYPMIKLFNELNVLGSLVWLILGAAFYTIGGVLYALKKPNFKSNFFGFHELFHILILLGTLSHFWFIFHYILYL